MEIETFDTIKFNVIGTLRPVAESEIQAAEDTLDCIFPNDYRSFVRKYGAGYFKTLPITVVTPRQILTSTPVDQLRLGEYWFWEKSSSILRKQDGIRSIACFDTDIGHDIRFLPEDASVMYVLSRDHDSITRCSRFADLVRLLDPHYDSKIYQFNAQGRG